MSDIKIIDDFHGEYYMFSNFYPAEIMWEDIVYPTTEHAFQAAKTLDVNMRMLISHLNTPHDAKRAGRSLVSKRPLWNEFIRFQVMDELITLKFSDAHHDLTTALFNTGDAVLIEGNYWHDNIWGSCRCDKCGQHGANALGRALMQRRTELHRGDDK